MRAYLVETPALGAAAQMAMDEALLNRAAGETLYLRFFRWGETAATFGVSQRFEEVFAALEAKDLPAAAPLVRRCTGGGLVLHDGDLTFSFVFPWPKICAPSRIYKRIHWAAHVGLKARGLASRPWPAKNEGAMRRECFEGPELEDLVDESGAKFLGGALRRRRGTGLYQGSLRPESLGAPPERIRGALAEGLSLEWGVLFEPAAPDPATAALAESLRAKKYSRDNWNKKR